MPRIRIIVLLLVLAVAAALGLWATLPANNDQSSSSRTTQTTQPLPPARNVVKDVPPELIPSYQAGAAECPRVPWTFYAAMGKHSSDHGRHLTGGQVRVEDGLVRGRSDVDRRALGSLPPGRQLRLPARHHDHRGQTAV